ncbi:MAG: nitroreductase family protein [Spirochaetes bacterium]|jgi:nitroreductase/Pyruvate/2-oxoacid:ferredoxin oxidoreductase delta subunit|nr:nitroreductase family protein [Spirochaetota bacterium]
MDNQVLKLRDFLSQSGGVFALNETVPPRVIKEKCTGCGICAKACPALVIEINNKKAEHVNKMFCAECGHCVSICPAGAVEDPLAAPGDYPGCEDSDVTSSGALQKFFRGRRSVREYKDKPVLRGDFEKILDAARYAPCGGNRPDVHYIVVSDPGEVRKLGGLVMESVKRMFSLVENIFVYWFVCAVIGKENAKTVKFYIPLMKYFDKIRKEHGVDRMFYHAPALMIVHGRKHDDSIPFSCAAGLYQASLMAHSLGIGCCFNGLLQVAINRDSKIRTMFDIPKNHTCFGAMTLGYQKYKYHRFVRRREAQVRWL